MDLYLLRHAIAVERGAPGYEEDRVRPLNPEGRRKLRRVIRGMKSLRLAFDVLLTSPYPRARETAEMVAAALRAKRRLQDCAALAPGGDPRRVVRELAAHARPKARVLLVGHEPDLSRLAARLIGGPAGLGLKWKKAGLGKLLVRGRPRLGACAELEWLLTPRQLMQLA